MDAEAKVSLDATGFEAGAEKVGRSSRAMANESKVAFKDLSDDATRAFSAVDSHLTDIGRSYRRAADEAERAGERVNKSNRRMAADSPARAGNSEAGHGGAGGARANQQEALHSVRALFDMSAAGADLSQAFQMELPRLMQAAGAGIGATIGIEAGVAIGKGLMNAINASKIEAEKIGALLAGGAGGMGYSTTGRLREQVGELRRAHDEIMDASGNGKAGEDVSLLDYGRRKIKDAYRSATGGESVEDENDRHMVELDAKRVQISDEIAHRRAAEVELEVLSLQRGKANVEVLKEKAALTERIRQINSDVDNNGLDATAAARMIDSERALTDARLKAIAREKADTKDLLALRAQLAEIRSPGVTKGLGFDKEDLQKFGGTKVVAAANAEFSQALADLQKAKDRHEDTGAASQNVTDKQSALAEILRSTKETERVLEREVGIEKQRASGQITLANNASAILAIEQQIAAAEDAGNTAAVKMLQTKKEQVIQAQKLQAYLHPERAAVEEQGGITRARDQRDSDLHGGLTRVTRGMDGTVVGGIDPSTNRYRETTPQERAAQKAAEKAGPYSGATKAKDAFGDYEGTPQMFDQTDADKALSNAPSADDVLDRATGDPDYDPAARLARASVFTDFDEGSSVAEENRPNAPQKPNAGEEGGGVVGAVNALVKQLQGIVAKLGTA